MGDAKLRGNLPRGGDPCGRAGHRQPQRQVAQRIRRGHAASGMEQMQVGVLRLRPFQPVQVARGQRHDAGAQYGGGRALIFAGLGVYSI